MDSEPLTQQRLRELAGLDCDPVLSLYLPTTGDGGDTRRPPLHLHNLLRDADRRLNAHGNAPDATERWLRPLAQLADDADLWRPRAEAVALFRWRAQLVAVRMMHPVEPALHVAPHAHLLPLLEPQAMSERFAVLALSLNRVRLVECWRGGVRPMEDDALPHDYASALGRFIDGERQLQFHTGATHAGRSGGAPVYHGQGGESAHDAARRTEFCRLVDRAVRSLLRGTDLPLVLAADVPMAAAYRRINRYHPLHDETLAGNADRLEDTALRDKALPLIERGNDERQVEAVQRYRETPPDGTVRDLPDVLLAAADGRIDTLLVRHGVRQLGRLRGRRVEAPAQPQENNGWEDLVNLAACLTLAARGNVLVLDGPRMPCTSATCAVLRY